MQHIILIGYRLVVKLKSQIKIHYVGILIPFHDGIERKNRLLWKEPFPYILDSKKRKVTAFKLTIKIPSRQTR